MARTGVSKQQIIKAATELAANGELPTAIKVRSLLTTGSIATIQKYLKAWKTACFKEPIKDLEPATTQELLEGQRILEQSLNQQIVKNEHYAQELIQAEKNFITLKEETTKLEALNQALKLELTEAKGKYEALIKLYQELKAALEFNTNEELVKQQQMIEGLQAEIKELNAKSIAAIQEVSNAGHEALMQEKITSMNLQEKINSMNKQLLELQQQLQTTTKMLNAKEQPLLAQLNWQQKIIQEHIGFEKLKQIEEQELMKKFTSKAKDYAK